MPSFNQVILMGHITRDIQLKYLPSQTAVAEFGLACNRKFKGQNGEEREEVLFVDCTAFGRTAENIQKYFGKGRPIFVTGRLRYESWDAKDGSGKRSKITVSVDQFEFVGGNRTEGGDATAGDAEPYSPPPARTQPPPKKSVGANGTPDDWSDFKESDIPF